MTLSDLSGDTGMQMDLLRDHRRDRHERLVEVGRELRAHLKEGNGLYQVLDVAPWHPAPEMRALRVPLDSSKGDDATHLSPRRLRWPCGRVKIVSRWLFN